MSQPTRRIFLASSIAAGSTALLHRHAHAASGASRRIVVGVMGVNGRGVSLARSFAQSPDCEVGWVCDVDSRALGKGVAAVDGIQERIPTTLQDVRKLVEEPSLDALVVAAPNHWHAPATILGCAHGKHVYVEKPCSHTPWEGETAIAAARHHNRVVTMGTQRRRYPSVREAMQRLHGGELGEILYSRCWYASRRDTIGKGNPAPVPEWLDYELWQGPCTPVPYKDNLIHYQWHWHWHWGNGELGNNGIHALDLARWGMQVDFPTRVTSAGGRYRFEDDQQTADTHVVCFEFGRRMITWEGLSWSPQGMDGSGFGVTFHGTKGMMHLFDVGYRIEDMQRNVIEEKTGSADDADHIQDFLSSIRDSRRPHADIEEAHRSTLLCHLGNIALRVGRSLETDPKDGRIRNDEEAAKYWTKEYREGWTPTF